MRAFYLLSLLCGLLTGPAPIGAAAETHDVTAHRAQDSMPDTRNSPPNTGRPTETTPEPQRKRESFSHMLSRNEGVITPEPWIDPEFVRPAPPTGPHSMPILPPPPKPGNPSQPR